MRKWLRTRFFETLHRALATDTGRDILVESLRGLIDARPPCLDVSSELPYPEVGRKANAESSLPPIFITGRFRSGSTLLWNVFRHLPGCTAYYEPLNERRWFEPQTRGTQTDATHKNVADYWQEYDGLAELGKYYNEGWIRRNLYMPGDIWEPALHSYISRLIEHAQGTAVLQFNRVDFRLAWLRRQFPSARIVHLYRHPRDQWVSVFHGGEMFPLDGRTADFEPFDRFYLLMWAQDLKHVFPFLDPAAADHPYDLFYSIWRLSYEFGKRYSDYSMSFEKLACDPQAELSALLDRLGLECEINESMLKIIERPRMGKWTEYASQKWFAGREARSDAVISDFFATRCRDKHEQNTAS